MTPATFGPMACWRRKFPGSSACPTMCATRAAQADADAATHTAKRLRAVLRPAFVEAYRRERLDRFDSAAFVADLGPEVHVVALFCVEREPAACHRA